MAGGLALTFGLCLATAGQFLGGHVPAAFGEALRVDGLSALVLVLCGFVGLLSGVYGIGYLRRNEARRPGHAADAPRVLRPDAGVRVRDAPRLGLEQSRHPVDRRRADDAGVGVPGDVPRPGHVARGGVEVPDAGQPGPRRSRCSARCCCSPPGQGHLGEGMSALHWTRFMQVAPDLHPFTLRLGVVFALIGYGTKAGLAPMHTWKPDAYREAPSPAGGADGGRHAERRALLRPADPSDFEGVAGTGVLGRPAVDAGAALGAHRDAVHPDPVEPQAPAGVFEHRARRHHGGRGGARRRGGGLRRAPAHDVSLAGQARGVLFGRHTRAAPQLLGLRPDRGAGRSRARRSRARCSSSRR